MRGKYDIIVGNTKIQYEFTLKRKYTFIDGATGTGKSHIVSLIIESYNRDSFAYMKSGGLRFDYAYDLGALRQFCSSSFTDVVIVDDESWVASKEFKEITEKASQYFLINGREFIAEFPFSMYEIYELRKYGTTKKKVLCKAERIFKDDNKLDFKPKLIITEDEQSGFTMFKRAYEDTATTLSKWFFDEDCKIVSAKGASNILKVFMRYVNDYDKIFICLDSAAFGAYAEDLYQIYHKWKDYGKRICVFTPESFEYLVLLSDIMKPFDIQYILKEPYNYIDTEKHLSWESYFEWLLCDLTRNKNSSYGLHQYSKNVPESYLKQANKVIDVIRRMN